MKILLLPVAILAFMFLIVLGAIGSASPAVLGSAPRVSAHSALRRLSRLATGRRHVRGRA